MVEMMGLRHFSLEKREERLGTVDLHRKRERKIWENLHLRFGGKINNKIIGTLVRGSRINWKITENRKRRSEQLFQHGDLEICIRRSPEK
jgi:hypothetical protein